jgi:prophage regulatory protein
MSITSTGLGKTLRVIRLGEVKRRTGLSTSTIYAMMARDEFPRQIRLGEGAVGWVEHEIDQFIKDRVAERDDAWQKLGDAAARAATKVASRVLRDKQ